MLTSSSMKVLIFVLRHLFLFFFFFIIIINFARRGRGRRKELATIIEMEPSIIGIESG